MTHAANWPGRRINMPEINAHLTTAIVKSHASDDRKYGLIGFRRERPDSMGSDMIWIGVPVAILPHLAVTAIGAIPQPGDSLSEGERAVFEIDGIKVGTGTDGQLVLTTRFQAGAELSVHIDEAEAQELLQQLQRHLGGSQAPPGTKPN
jgi:hypothetical protein